MVSLKEMARLDAARQPPAWLRPLLGTTFFEACPEHPAVTAIRSPRSVGCNFFCTNCAAGAGALCYGCFAGHRGHQLIQIRKSSAHALVRVSEIEHLLNVSFVQTYILNGEDAVYLNKREITGKGRAYTNRCEDCNWGLVDSDSRFCSLGCKAEEIEYGLDFSVTFAVDQRRESSGEESESDHDDYSPRPTKFQKKQGTLSRSRSVAGLAAKGKRSV